MKEFAESVCLEQLTVEICLLKILKYHQTVNDMLEECRCQREEELQQLQRMHELEMEEERATYVINLSKMLCIYFNARWP
jgi:hypothetical protein